MFRSYTITCRFCFEHDGRISHRVSQLVYYDNNMLAIRMHREGYDLDIDSELYVLSSYSGSYWLANTDKQFSVFIEDPADAVSTASCLRETDDISYEYAEEIAEIIRHFYFMTIPNGPVNDEYNNLPYLEDDTLPF